MSMKLLFILPIISLGLFASNDMSLLDAYIFNSAMLSLAYIGSVLGHLVFKKPV